jgi:hypothetical protein
LKCDDHPIPKLPLLAIENNKSKAMFADRLLKAARIARYRFSYPDQITSWTLYGGFHGHPLQAANSPHRSRANQNSQSRTV